jgi:DNA replication and repair protein RecF
MSAQTYLTQVVLSDFRNYEAASLKVGAPMVALVGENGAGKTNILEALSLFAPGRGLRRAEKSEIARKTGTGTWTVSLGLETPTGPMRLGTGYLGEEGGRQNRIDGEPVSSQQAFTEVIKPLWLIPAMDGLFTGPPSERRRTIDRMVLAFDAEHGTRVNSFEKAMRSRNKLLEDTYASSTWLDAVERDIAERGVAISAARMETIDRIARLMQSEPQAEQTPFPRLTLALQGEMEAALRERSALHVEDEYREALRKNRPLDRAAGRSLIGPQTSDLHVTFTAKNMPAEHCSTGEQKALLLALTLAHTRLVAESAGFSPLLLLDEVVAHLDQRRRAALLEELRRTGANVWMTGTDAQPFEALEAGIEIVHVKNGQLNIERNHG